jgi:4-diphosphocytidyl-2-C-methyl-D-erythritol kinase
MSLTLQAPAKTNLNLHVRGKRDDGFHEIETRMLPLSLADTVEIEAIGEEVMKFSCSDPKLPPGEENLAVKAVRALEALCDRRFGVRVHVEKFIPSGAGLGGGSSDAAAVLRGMNQTFELGIPTEELAAIAAGIGSDVPFFIYETVCDCRGRGEIVSPVEFAWDLPVFLMKPAFGTSAGWAYQSWENSREIPNVTYVPQLSPWGTMVNDLERPVFQKFIALARMKMWLLEQREVHAAILSGSGSCLLAVLTRNDRGRLLEEKALRVFGDTTWTWVGHSIGTHR